MALFTGSSRFSEEWDLEELLVTLRNFFPTTLTLETLGDSTELDAETLADAVVEDAIKVYEAKEQRFGAEAMSEMVNWVLLRTIDSKWREHLYEMDYLREGIGLRALAQRDPLVEYKNEGFQLFQEMMESIQSDFVRYIYHLEIVKEEETKPVPARPARLLRRRRQQPGTELRGHGGGRQTVRRGRQLRRGLRRCPGRHSHGGGPSLGEQGGAERSLPVRQRQEVQEVLRGLMTGLRAPRWAVCPASSWSLHPGRL